MRVSPLIISALCSSVFAVNACTASNADTQIQPSEVLSFHMVRPESKSAAAMVLAEDGKLPPGAIYRTLADDESGLILEKKSRLTMDCIDKADVGEHPVHGGVILNFAFDAECTEIFAEQTAKAVGKRFAVLVNGEIVTAPTINSAITDGTGFLEGGFSDAQAHNLADTINAASKIRNAD